MPLEETILLETRQARAQVEALVALLSPDSAEDPVAVMTAALTALTSAVSDQTAEINELRAEIAQLSNRLQALD